MYWPEDLPLLKDCGVTQSGRRNYHGKHELIASNHMEVVDVCTFAGLASVTCWKETHDEETQTDLYWRQTFDYRTAQLSVSFPRENFCSQTQTNGSETGTYKVLHLQEILQPRQSHRVVPKPGLRHLAARRMPH